MKFFMTSGPDFICPNVIKFLMHAIPRSLKGSTCN